MSEQLSNNIMSGDPAPLGLAGFAFTTFVLSFANSGLFGNGNPGTVAYNFAMIVVPLAFFWGGLAQFVAGIFEMRKGNTFGFTAFCSYGAFWLFYAFFVMLIGMSLIAPGVQSAKAFDQAMGLVLILWGIFTFYMWIPAMHLNLMLNLTFLLLWVTFILLGAGSYLQQTGLTNMGGIVGIATAVVAAYGSFAIVTNTIVAHKLPLGPAIAILGKK